VPLSNYSLTIDIFVRQMTQQTHTHTHTHTHTQREKEIERETDRQQATE